MLDQQHDIFFKSNFKYIMTLIFFTFKPNFIIFLILSDKIKINI